MKVFFEFLEKRLAPLGEKLGNQRHLKALREGIMMAMPLVLIGSIFVLIASFPIDSWTNWLKTHWQLDVLLNTMVNNTFGLIALVTSFGIAYRLAESYNTDGPSAGVLALSSFLLVTPTITDANNAAGIPYGMLGGKGLFAAIVVAIISAEIYRWFIQKNITIKMPESVPEVVSKSFSALIPGTVIILFFSIVLKVLDVLELGSLNNVLAFVIGKPLGLIGGTLPGTFIAVLLNSIFWFCGVNGGQVVGSVMKSNEYRTLGKISGIPALFNINTAILFSFPTVLNPIMIIPFVLTPVVNAIITYFAMVSGLVPLTTGVTLPWTTPPIIGGFLATGGSWQGAALQVVLVAVSFLIYYPFFKSADKRNLAIEKKNN